MKSLLLRWRRRLCLDLLVALGVVGTVFADSADLPKLSTDDAFNLAVPPLLTGQIYALGSHRKQLLFKFQRSAIVSGNKVHVERWFKLPDGSVAAMEKITYESGRLVAYHLQDFQSGLWGIINITGKPDASAKQKIFIQHGHQHEPADKGAEFDLPKHTLIDDTVYPCILNHWEELMRGETVKFRFVSLDWEKTFQFKLVKDSETVSNGQNVVRIKMTPTSLIVSHFMAPILFTIDKSGTHRIVEYVGRTTPRVKSGKSWKYLDAETVFDQN